MKQIFQIVAIDVTGYDTFGEKLSLGYYSSFEIAMINLPNNFDKDSIICIHKIILDTNKQPILCWTDDFGKAKHMYKNIDILIENK